MYRYYYKKRADNDTKMRVFSAGVMVGSDNLPLESLASDMTTAIELCVKLPVQLSTADKSRIDQNLQKAGYIFDRMTIDRKPRTFADLVSAVDAFLDTNAKIKAAVVRLVALAILEKQPADHGFGAIDGTEAE